jgi:hypothetical protein
VRPTTPWQLRLAIVFSGLQAAALVVYCIAIGIAARDSRGSTVTATGWEIAIYLCFAVMLGLICRGLIRRNSLARTPFLLAQAFVAIVGWTVLVGDGAFTKAVGAIILAVGVVGLITAFLPGLVAALEQGPAESS